MQPLVSVICLCYNHEKFLVQALESVRQQTYLNLEVLIIDDCSTDNSPALLRDYCTRNPQFKLILLAQNVGNCRAFNHGFKLSAGEFIVDFATDDILLPSRIADQMAAFTQLDPRYGIIYTNAELINEESHLIRNFYKPDKKGYLIPAIANGDVYAEVLQRYFICTPTLLIRRKVFEKLNGYDERLAYEDFDLLVRAARYFKFYYLDKILTKRRLHAQQLSKGWYKPGDKQLQSTILVCKKALKLNQTESEKNALIIRVKWEIKQAYFTKNFPEAAQLLEILKELQPALGIFRLVELLVKNQVDLSFIQRAYYKLKYD